MKRETAIHHDGTAPACEGHATYAVVVRLRPSKPASSERVEGADAAGALGIVPR